MGGSKVRNYRASGFDGEKTGTCLLSVPVPEELKRAVRLRMVEEDVPSISEWVRRLVVRELNDGENKQ